MGSIEGEVIQKLYSKVPYSLVGDVHWNEKVVNKYSDPR
jgi:hypothetical protein